MTTSIDDIRVLFIARSEGAVRTDSKSLRRLGFSQIKIVSTSAKAFALLTNQDDEEGEENAPPKIIEKAKPLSADDLPPIEGSTPFDFIVCDEVLFGMDAPTFIRTMKADPNQPKLPLMVLTSSPSVYDAIKASGVVALARPYSLDQLESAVIAAADYFRGPLQALRLKEEEELNIKKKTKVPTTAELYNTALALLQAKRLPEAEKLLNYAIKLSPGHLECYVALFKVYSAVNNPAKLNRFLLKAVVACLRAGDMTKAKAFAGKLPEALRKGNLFKVEAEFLLREGDFLGAASTFLEAYATQTEAALYGFISTACKQAKEPEKAYRNLCAAFAQIGHICMARRLHIRNLVKRAEVAAAAKPKQVVTSLS